MKPAAPDLINSDQPVFILASTVRVWRMGGVEFESVVDLS